MGIALCEMGKDGPACDQRSASLSTCLRGVLAGTTTGKSQHQDSYNMRGNSVLGRSNYTADTCLGYGNGL